MNKLSRIFRPFHITPKKTMKIFHEKDTVSKSYKVIRRSFPHIWFSLLSIKRENCALQLLCRYGIIHRSSTGMYHILPMGQRAIDKLVKLVEQHMRLIGAQKMSLPVLTQQHLWKKTGSYSAKSVVHVCIHFLLFFTSTISNDQPLQFFDSMLFSDAYENLKDELYEFDDRKGGKFILSPVCKE